MIRKTLALAALAATLATAAVAGENRTGQLASVAKYATSGSVTVSKDASGYVVTLGPQFAFDGAPDPKIGFGNDGTYVEGTLIGALQSNTGAQTYRVPDTIDPASFNNVFVWCERYSVPLAYATLN